MADLDKLQEVAKEVLDHLDTVKTWFSTGSARHRAVSDQADKLAEALGGRQPVAAGGPSVPTPGPGVKMPAAPVEVDSVGDIADTPPPPPGGKPADQKQDITKPPPVV